MELHKKLSGVIRKGSNLYYRPKVVVEKRHLTNTTKDGYLSPSIPLGKNTDPELTIVTKYKTAVAHLSDILDPVPIGHGTVNWLKEEYFKSREFLNKIKPKTQDDARSKIELLCKFEVTANGAETPFGDVALAALSRPFIKSLKDDVYADYIDRGCKGERSTNSIFGYFSAMLTYGLDNFEEEELGWGVNPCSGVKRITPPKYTRYLMDKDYYAQVEYACATKDEKWLPVFFELSYLLAARRIEVLNLKFSDILDIGILVRRAKGSDVNIVAWSPRLRKAYRAALELHREEPRGGDQLVISRDGILTESAVKSSMSRLKKHMRADGLEKVYWTLHDLKRKGISDSEQTSEADQAKYDLGGHKMKAMQQLYDNKIYVVNAPVKGVDFQPELEEN